jgi:hypothetical protein
MFLQRRPWSNKGVLNPVLKGYQVVVAVGTGVISTYTNDLRVLLNGVPAGTYTLTLTPEVASEKRQSSLITL